MGHREAVNTWEVVWLGYVVRAKGSDTSKHGLAGQSDHKRSRRRPAAKTMARRREGMRDVEGARCGGDEMWRG